MSRTRIAALSIFLITHVCAPLSCQEPSKPTPLSYEDVRGGRRLFGPSTKGYARWSEDGALLVIGGEWFHPLTGERAEKPAAKPAPEATEARPALDVRLGEALKTLDPNLSVPRASFRRNAVRSTLPRIPESKSYTVASGDEAEALVVHEGRAFLMDKTGAVRLLKDSASAFRHAHFAPGGERISVIDGFDLCIIDAKTGTKHKVSTDGSESLFYGELDWVYQEEVYGRGEFLANWWSGDGAHLAFMRIDESLVAEFSVVDEIPTRLEIERLRYPKAGDGNPQASLHVAHAESKETVAVDLSKYSKEDEILIVHVGWSPDSKLVVFQVQDREQTWLDLNTAEPATGKCTTLFRETSRAWVNRLEQPRWLPDGTFLWESERTGYRHLYHYKADGTLIAAMTKGDWQVSRIVDVDTTKKEVLFVGSKDGAIDTNFYVASFDGKSLRRLTEGQGSHDIRFNAQKTHFLDTVSSLSSPGEQRLCKADGTIVRVVAKADPGPDAVKHGLRAPELLSVKARDGYPLDVSLVLPAQREAGKTYPIWISTYSGPDAPSIRNSWRIDPMQQLLAQEGIISLSVNVRSASGRGQHHTDLCYRNFGVQELKDIEDAIAFVCAERQGDQARVGITGWSYGGFMAAYALTHSKAFKVGIAGAGVYDWRNYDTIYTERYMRRPQNNAEGYAKSSCVEAAAELSGHLLIVHGATDDNVHVQNAMQLAYALQRANKPFEMMIYPRTRHGFSNPMLNQHYQNLVWRTIKEHL